MSNPFERFVSAFLAIVMIVAMVPSQVFAASEDGSERESLVSADSVDLNIEPGQSEDDPVQPEDELLQSEDQPQSADDVESGQDDQSDIPEDDVSAPVDASDTMSPSNVTITASDCIDSVTVSTVFSSIYSDKVLLGNGTCGSNLNWYLYDDGELYISGNGPMNSFTYTTKTSYGQTTVTWTAPWKEHQTQITAVTIEDGVTTVGSNAFYGCFKIRSATLPSSLATIEQYAFYNCTSLEDINFPSSLRSIDEHAFDYCRSLTAVYLPNGVTIGHSAFASCYQLCAVELPQDMTELPPGIFESCEKLVSIDIPEGVISIGADALRRTGIADLELPSGLQSIGNAALFSCSNLQRISFFNTTTVIENYAFQGCSKLKYAIYVGTTEQWDAISMGTSNETLTNATRYCIADLSEIFHLSVSESENGSITLSDSYALSGQTITIDSLPSVGYALDTIFVNGEAIEGNQFVVVGNATVSATFKPYKALATFGSCGANIYWCLYDDGELVIYGNGAMRDYENYGYPTYSYSTPWYRVREQIKTISVWDGITRIGDYAFCGCSSVETISLPNTLEVVGAYAFSGCSSAKSIYIPDSVTAIDEYSFNGCSSATALHLSKAMTAIPEYAFYGCKGLTSLVVPAGIKSIATCGLDCDNLSRIEFLGDAPSLSGVLSLPSSIAGFSVLYYHKDTSGWTSPDWNGYYAVCIEEEISDFSTLGADNTNQQGIVFTLNTTAKTAVVGTNSDDTNNSGYYGNMNGIVYIPDVVVKDGLSYRVVGVGQNAFYLNSTVTAVNLGKYVSSVDTTAFVACDALSAFSVSEESTFFSSIDGILYDKMGLQLYKYPGAKGDKEFSIPTSVLTISTNAFYDACNIKKIYVPQTVTTINRGAFYGCDTLEEITIPFVGGNSSDRNTFYYVFRYGTGSSQYTVPKSLTTINLTGSLKSSAFSTGCGSVKTIIISNCGTSIPSNCFSGCASLKTLTFVERPGLTNMDGIITIPDEIETVGSGAFQSCSSIVSVTLENGVQTIESNAFYSCTGLKAVTIPVSVSSIYASSFRYCTSLETFAVDPGNNDYVSDKWGVLYTKNYEQLLNYPSARIWPYYTIPAETSTINGYAFYKCVNLVNLLVPETVSTLNYNSVYECAGLMMCVYQGSEADAFALDNGLTTWYIDNYTLQGIEVYTLPEQVVDYATNPQFDGMYIVANYGGKLLQLDDYELVYSKNVSGKQTVEVVYEEKSTTFDSIFYNSLTETIIDFGYVPGTNGANLIAAIYSDTGQMLHMGYAEQIEGTVYWVVSNGIVSDADNAKVFGIDGATYAPKCSPATVDFE